MSLLDSRNRKVSKDYAYFEIKQRIISWELQPGQTVIEENLAKELEISRTPLREALQRLEIEELIIRQPNGRLRVASISVQEVEEIFVVRSYLEGIIAREVVRSASDKDIEALADIARKIEASYSRNRPEDVLEYGSQFHNYLYHLSGNKTAVKMLSMLNGHIDRYRRLVPAQNKIQIGQAIEEHALVLTHIAGRDADAAESAMRKHVLNSLATAIEAIKKYKVEQDSV